jgi:hypothetical protein
VMNDDCVRAIVRGDVRRARVRTRARKARVSGIVTTRRLDD